jgi:hypothetical protein
VRSVSKWMGVALVPVVVGTLVWWGLRPPPESSAGAPAPLPSNHQRCELLPGATPGPEVLGPIAAKAWDISVARVRVAPSIPANDGGEYRAEPDRAFVVVDLDLRRRGSGRGEAAIKSDDVAVTCADGMTMTPWGWEVEGGFCPQCSFELGVEDRATTLAFVLKLEQDWVDQAFEVRYAGAGPLRFVPPVP